MSLFFFNFFDGESHSTDETGVELASIELAYLEAKATALQMWPDLLAENINPTDCSFLIANEFGLLLITFEFSELMKGKGSGSHQPSKPLETMCSAIAETHRRARLAKTELDAAMEEARRSLKEAKALLAGD